MTNRRQARGELRERFYQSVAETLSLLHTAPGYDRRLALAEVARILAATMDLPLVWIGRREPGQAALDVLAAAGPEAAYATALKISADEREPGGGGPVAHALREGRARAVNVDAPEFAPWQADAHEHGLGSCIVAAATTRDTGQLTLAAYARAGAPMLNEELLDWAQRLADELVRFWDHQALLERNLRMSRYRDAQRTIQRALLDQPDPAAVYRTLAQALVDIAGAEAVDVYAGEGDGELLQRVALVGPIAEAMRLLPVPPRHSDGAIIFTPTLAFMRGTPVVRVRPAEHADASAAWKLEPLVRMGAVGCWPLFASDGLGADRQPSGVFAVVTAEADAFDAEMRLLLDEIADAAGLALRQHQQRSALLHKQELQTYLALHDALTDVPNRRALDHHLGGVLARAEQHGRIVAVGLLDLDDLKPINDRHGHAAGDRILVEVAARLCGALRNQDYVARLGGDEFVLVFEDLEREQDLDALLARVWQALQQPLVIDGVTFQISASLGIALYPIHAQASGEQLLRCADQAMYQVKARKRQRDRWWALPARQDDADASGAHDGRGPPPYGKLAAELLWPWFTALEAQLPRMAEGYYSELQAHARLRDDDGSVLPPVRFLPALGDDDLIVLFRHALRQATVCRQALLLAGHALDVSVNAPAAALTDPRYAEVAAGVLANTACPARALLFEILESPIGTDHAAPAGMAGMQALKALGVRLVEDDLGAGYSTLIRLRQWPFDRVKIDQAIVRQIGDEPLPTLRFIRQLIRLGHDLGLEVVVEGLETAGSVEAALILGADLGQGYVLARPMPAEALADWLCSFKAAWDAAVPATAAGALAAALLWEEQFQALPAAPPAWQAHAATCCTANGYLHLAGQTPPVLHSAHLAMRQAAVAGPADPAYRQARESFLSLLVERVRIEEHRCEAAAGDAGAGNDEGPGNAGPFVVDQWWAVQGSNL